MYSQSHEIQVKARWDTVGKPLNSLGDLETTIARLGGMLRTDDVRLDKRCLLVFCADNGIVEEGVTQTSNAITALNSRSIATGGACVNAFARKARVDVFCVDIGIATEVDCPQLIQKKVMPGTHNFLKQPAMSKEQALRAIEVGKQLVLDMKNKGYHIICTGEMGIGNTTTSSAMAAALLSLAPEAVTGRGAGLSDAGLIKKKAVIARALEQYQLNADDPLAVLQTVGGLDIAAMTGVFLGGALYGMPIVIDGFISGVAALTAVRMNPEAGKFMLASHMGREPACALLLDALKLRAPLHANLALGEGTGAVALLPFLDLGLEVYHTSSTFQTLQMQAYTHFDTP